MGSKTGRPKALKKEIRELIIRRAINERDTPREELADDLVKQIEDKGEIAPSFETLKKYISNARNQETSDLDTTWTIGSCIKYDIPAEIVPMLIREQQLRMNSNLGPGNLTIREAIWFARLYPALNQIAQKLFPNDDPMIWHGMVSIASRQYSHKEQISELMDKEYADTRDLDNTFLVKEDFSIWSSLRDWAQITLKEERDLRYAEEESEPTKIDGFVTYSQVVSDKKDKSPKRQKPLEGNYRNGGQGK